MLGNIKKSYILAIIFWLTIWQLVSMKINKEILLVSPFLVCKKLLELSFKSEFWISISNSFTKIMIGFLLGFLFGIIFSVISSYYKIIKIFLEPLILSIQSIPVASIIILLLVWVSSNNLSIVISFLMSFPIVYRNTLDAINNIRKEIKDMTKVFNVSKYNKLRYVYLSEISNNILTCSNVALGLCFKSGIAAEIIGIPNNSIGENLYEAKIFLNTSELFAWTVVIIIVSFIFQKSFLFILNLIFKNLEQI